MEQKMPQGSEIHYETIGDGRPVLILHGWSLDLGVMKPCLEPVFAGSEGWKRIYVDLPGMGASPPDPGIRTTEGMVTRLVGFIDDVIGMGPLLLCGESYGAYLARAILRARFTQVGGMFLFCPIVLPDKSQRTLPEPRTIYADKALLEELPPDAAQRFASMATVQDGPRWDRFQAEILPALGRADQMFLNRIRDEGYGCPYDVDDLPEPFEKPVAILAGRQDASVGYADAFRLSERYPRATFAVLDHGAHVLQLEQSTLFEALASEWLDRISEGG